MNITKFSMVTRRVQHPKIFHTHDLTIVARAAKFGDQSTKFRQRSHLRKMVGHHRTQIFGTYSIPMLKKR